MESSHKWKNACDINNINRVFKFHVYKCHTPKIKQLYDTRSHQGWATTFIDSWLPGAWLAESSKDITQGQYILVTMDIKKGFYV